MTHMLQVNADRFAGFADIYDKARPVAPQKAIEIILRYLNDTPSCVVDLGCGTGLSTMVWEGRADTIIGIEPSQDMIEVSRRKAQGHDSVRFLAGFSDATGLCDSSADIVTCSQSFHWMEPEKTLTEVTRILKDGGVFAAYDCDWPPVCLWEAEKKYQELLQTAIELQKNFETPEQDAVRWPKEGHLENFRRFGSFRYVREIVFSNTETCDANRWIGLILSQGEIQSLLQKSASQITPLLDTFSETVRAIFAEKEIAIDFCYRMRIGIK